MYKQQLKQLKQLRSNLEDLLKEFIYLTEFYADKISYNFNDDLYNKIGLAYTDLIIAEKIEKGELYANINKLNKLVCKLQDHIKIFTNHMSKLTEDIIDYLSHLGNKLKELADDNKDSLSTVDLPDWVETELLEAIESTDKVLLSIEEIKNNKEDIDYEQINELINEIKELINTHESLKQTIRICSGYYEDEDYEDYDCEDEEYDDEEEYEESNCYDKDNYCKDYYTNKENCNDNSYDYVKSINVSKKDNDDSGYDYVKSISNKKNNNNFWCC